MAPNATKPSIASQDLPQEKKVPLRIEIVLATLPVLAKGNFKGKGLEALEVALTQSTKAPTKDIIVIKSNFLFFLILFLFPEFVISLTFCKQLSFF